MTMKDLDTLVRTLCLLIAAYEPELEPLDLDKVDNKSYAAGFRAGARSAYSDVVCRLRDTKADAVEPSNVVRIGGTA